MGERIVGHVIDPEGLPLEVWVHSKDETVVIRYNGSQEARFAFGKPGPSEVERLAQRVAAGEAKKLACMGTDNARSDTGSDHNRNRTIQGNETVH